MKRIVRDYFGYRTVKSDHSKVDCDFIISILHLSKFGYNLEGVESEKEPKVRFKDKRAQ